MIIDLTDVLSEQHKPIEKDVPLEMEQFHRDRETFPIVDKGLVHVLIEYVEEQKLVITGRTKLAVNIPCDRCLADVKMPFDLDFRKDVDLRDEASEADEEMDEKNFIEGKELDVEELIRNEILVAWPMKILCKEDCPGIVYEKEEALDPRMAAALDVFKNFQEK